MWGRESLESKVIPRKQVFPAEGIREPLSLGVGKLELFFIEVNENCFVF